MLFICYSCNGDETGCQVLLLIDRNKSQHNPDFIPKVAKHRLTVFCIPPDTKANTKYKVNPDDFDEITQKYLFD